ncbi:MAG: dUTP diphosphatase [Brockia lithotrophica]|nr:dUTP diphosphatase [Brockia lithotrophica]
MDVLVRWLCPHKPPRIPYPATPGAAGYDLAACLDRDVVLRPGERALIPTGLAVALPGPDVALLVLPRSGTALRLGLSLANAAGVIDGDYRGEIKLIAVNLDPHEPVTIRDGDRIAQMLFVPVLRPELRLVEELPATERGEGGFGSTGIRS